MKTKYIVISVIAIFVLGLGAVLFFVVNKELKKISDTQSQLDTVGNSWARINNAEVHRDSLIQFGIYAPAIITKVEDLNVTFNKNPKVRLSLKVSPKDEDQFVASCDVFVSRAQVPRIGDRVKAYYNKADKNDISVE